jgi:sugar phosphate permease
MNESEENKNQSERLPAILNTWLVYLKKTFLYAISVAAIVGVSFLFTGGFTGRAYSDRLFIAGVLITLVGVFVFITIGGTRKNMGIPTFAKTEEDARKIMDHAQELRDKAEKRYDAGAQVWAVGIACMVLSIMFFFLMCILRFLSPVSILALNE